MGDELEYQIALSMVPHIGHVQARALIPYFDSAEAIFKASPHHLQKIEGIGETRASCIRRFNSFELAAAETAFIKQNEITALFITNPAYPQRLLNCNDAPILLYYKGNADLNKSKMVAIVGTRHATAYGKQAAKEFIRDLAPYEVCIVSGMAYGIDAAAHQSCLDNRVPTVGVLAHGLDFVYPPEHKKMAREMIANGGLLTEFRSDTMPDKHNFPTRNRIVAGMCDATIVLESGIKGGSLITAELANGYNRDVFAMPGRIYDQRSQGCNQLIRENKACILNSAAELAEMMGWLSDNKPTPKKQREIFVDLSDEEKKIVEILEQIPGAHIDQIYLNSGFSSSTVAAAILKLELHQLIIMSPGKFYRLQ